MFSPIKNKKTVKKIESKNKTRKKKKNFDVLQIDGSLTNIHFFADICRVLNLLKKKINYSKWDSKTIEKIGKFIPKIKVNSFNPKKPYTIIKPKYTSITKTNKKNGLVYGNVLIYIKIKISVGANGEIYKGIMKYPGGAEKPVIIKVLKKKNAGGFYNFLRESIIQNEIFCDQRKKKPLKVVPKIEFIGKFKEKTEGVIKEHFIIGMEEMDGDFHHFNDINTSKLSYKKKPEEVGTIYDSYLKSLIQISQKIAYLQKEYLFNHNDFHMGNVMYKKKIVNGEEIYQWYIIDFGMSCFEKDGIFMCADKYRRFNSTHDLRMLFTSLYENLPPRYVRDKSVMEKKVKDLSKSQKGLWKQEAFYLYITRVVMNMSKYVDISIVDKPLFHKFYHEVKIYDDINTIPSKVIANLQNILNLKKGPKIKYGFMVDGDFYFDSIISSESEINSSDSSSSINQSSSSSSESKKP